MQAAYIYHQSAALTIKRYYTYSDQICIQKVQSTMPDARCPKPEGKHPYLLGIWAFDSDLWTYVFGLCLWTSVFIYFKA